MSQLEQIPKHIKNYFITRKNKRYGRDSAEYEVDWVSNMVKSLYKRDDRTFRITKNYAFLVSHPKWREIFATCFDGRMADHELCDRLMPFIELELSPRTFNNRVGKGQKAAIELVIRDIYEVTEGYTKPARIIKFDLKGFFPNALCSHIQKCFDQIIDKYITDEEENTYLHWLTKVCVYSDPAKNCELRTPQILWDIYIDPEKSLFSKPYGVGIPIGRLTSLIGMGLYINDIIKWVTDECKLKMSMFMDDGVFVVEENKHKYALSLLLVLRQKFKIIGIRMNEAKFYDQPYEHGLEFLGVHVKPGRTHTNNKIFRRAVKRIYDMNKKVNKFYFIDKFVASINSYTGMLKTKQDYNRVCVLQSKISHNWEKWLTWNNNRLCIQYLSNFSINCRFKKTYRLKLHNYD